MSVHELETAIEMKREQMMISAHTLGFCDEQTIKHSQDLDVLVVLYMERVRTL